MTLNICRKYYNIGKNQLFPICRSITGNGVRETFNIIKKKFSSFKTTEIKSGEKIFDWVVPPEWNISDAYIIDKNGEKIVDFKKNNLHVIGYSSAVNLKLDKKMLLKKLYSLPNLPDAIPYLTSYYKKDWGFCITENQKRKIKEKYDGTDKFEVRINSKFNYNGSLTFGEYVIKGQSDQEILISTYICHPSMANNELSGPIVSMALMDFFRKKKNKKTLKFIFVPETIGSIAYLNLNLEELKKRVIGGYVLTCIGDERQYSCMLSKYHNTVADESLLEAFKKLKINYKVHSFLERGSDERQYNSPGIELPIASIFRSKYGDYPEYHSSLDNFNLVTLNGIHGGFKVTKESIQILQKKQIPVNRILCEPKLGKRNLYPTLKNNHSLYDPKIKNLSRQILNFLQYADGKNDIKKIAKLIRIDVKLTKELYKLLKKKKLVI